MFNKEKANIGRIYFTYLLSMLMLQILGIDAKGSFVDTAWKGVVISITLVYCLSKGGIHDIRLLLPIAVYIIGQMIAIIIFPFALSATLSTNIVTMLIIISMVYLFLSFPYGAPNAKLEYIDYFFNWFIGLVIFSMVYNTITNPSTVFQFMNREDVYANMMNSFFDNKQTFGMFIFLGLIATLSQFAIKKKKIYIVISIPIFMYLFICMSRTALFSFLIYVFVLSVILINEKTGLPFILFLSVGIVAIIIWLVPSLQSFIINVVLDADKTVDVRASTWEAALGLLHGVFFVFGFGDGNSSYALRMGGYSKISHNGFVQVLITGGLVKLVLYIIALIFVFRILKRIYIHNRLLSKIFFAALVGVMAYSMGEAVVLFDTSAWCVASTIICVGLPCVADRYYKESKESPGNKQIKQSQIL